MAEDLDKLTEPEAPPPRRIGWGVVAGAGFGLALGTIWALRGFWPALLAAVLALVGGLLGRFYLGESDGA